MDILISTPTIMLDIKKLITNKFNTNQMSKNGNVFSFLHGLDNKYDFQIDLIFTKEKYFDSSLNYFAYNDLGNLLGRLFHKFGLKYGYDGLSFQLRDGDYLLKTIHITQNIDKILSFLELDPMIFQNGFDEIEDIFKYVSSSKYFHPDIYLFHNRSHKSRIRDKKRKTYNEFLQWCEINYDLLNKFKWHDNSERYDHKIENSSRYLNIIFNYFPVIINEYNYSFLQLELHKKTKSIFNGEFVMNITNLSGKKLGKFMTYYKSTFNDKDDFQKYILNMPIDDIKSNIYVSYNNWKNSYE